MGLVYFACTHTLYILICFPLLTCSLRSTYSCLRSIPAPVISSSTSPAGFRGQSLWVWSLLVTHLP